MTMLEQGRSFLCEILESGFNIIVNFLGKNDKQPKKTGNPEKNKCESAESYEIETGMVYYGSVLEDSRRVPAGSTINFTTNTITIYLNSDALLAAAKNDKEGSTYYADEKGVERVNSPPGVILHELIHQLFSIMVCGKFTPTVPTIPTDENCKHYWKQYGGLERMVETWVNVWRRSMGIPINHMPIYPDK